MSSLYRSAISARLAKLPAELPPYVEEEDGEGDSLGDLPPGGGMGPPAMQVHLAGLNPAYAPISAESYFADAAEVSVPGRELNFRIYYTPPKFADGAVMVCHHGAGYSGLSFALFAREVTDMTKGECGVLAIDARRHGKTTSSSDDNDLSIEALVQDFVELMCTVFPDPKAAPTLLLIGHSMGGSVVVRASSRLLERKYNLVGVAILDIVEGSALEALPHMNSLLNARPEGFDSVEEAIEWHLKTKTIQNVESARVSIPAAVCEAPEGSRGPKYIWRTPLRSTAPYWQDWFTGLSSSFLAVRSARLLVLAGTDRLDKPLMIGQMQGKFQMEVIPGVGHMLQEDDPRRFAEIMVAFLRRNERVIVGNTRLLAVGAS
ncbi:protein phosphatase methylesterase [Fistulina hepatica ATCC 64428]|uniref:Protein phosphatase methylesterase 1 n=1 Tax=Fistulina hepatica ATCC 64428 TaxID=1128425 RepID=A0A0D7AFC6_9AGAR|nr:protein phosphatase methylesterase [Fistulina hepatica ATCC 64428]